MSDPDRWIDWLPQRFRERHGRDLRRLRGELRAAGDPRVRGWRGLVDALRTLTLVHLDELRKGRGPRRRRASFADRLGRDLHQAGRRLLATPGFTAVALATLAIGIGANTAIYSVFHRVLLAPPRLPEPDRLVAVWHTDLETGSARNDVTPGNFRDWRASTAQPGSDPPFAALAALSTSSALLGEGSDRRPVTWARTTGDFFATVGVPPALGTVYGPVDDASGPRDVVVLGHRLWRELGADPGIVGNAVVIEGERFRVLGVQPEGFDFGFERPADLWSPVGWTDSFHDNRDEYFLGVVGRLADGVGIARAGDELAGVMAGIRGAFPKETDGVGVRVEPLQEALSRPSRAPLRVAMGAVVLVLLIGCVNLSGLLTARGEDRRHEMGVRRALGASTAQLVRLTMAESLLLALGGGVLGLGVAAVVGPALVGRLPIDLDPSTPGALTAPGVAFACLAALAAGTAFGVAPALRLPRAALLRTAGGVRATASRHGASTWIFALSALSVLLLAGAGLLARSAAEMHATDPGFPIDDLVSVPLRLVGTQTEENAALVDRFLDSVRAQPGVASAALAINLPLSDDWNNAWINRPELAPPEGSAPPWVAYRAIVPGYFETLGIRVVRGRTLDDADGRRGAGGVVINRAAAERFWPGGLDPFAERITLGPADGFFPAVPVVGIVDDGINSSVAAGSRPIVYFHYDLFPVWSHLEVALRLADGASGPSLDGLQRIAAAADSRLTVFPASTFSERLREQGARPRTLAVLVGAFSVVGLAQAALGIFGTLSISVARRTREIGLRMALGADPGRTARAIVGQTLLPVVVGLGVGLAAAAGAARRFEELLFAVGPADARVLVLVAAVLCVTALGAAWRPVVRAVRIDPARVLRGD